MSAESIRLLHLSDVHIGARFLFLGAKGDEQRRALREALERAVALARDGGYAALLVAGDLFDSAFASGESEVSFVVSALAAAGPACRVVVLPGSHDCWIPGSIFERERDRFESRGNVRILSPDRPSVEFAELSLAVHGRALESPAGVPRALAGLAPSARVRWNVCLAHGSVEGAGAPLDANEEPIRLGDLAPGFDYVALGHWHSHLVVPGTTPLAAYSGSPEIIARDQRGAGSVIAVTLSDAPARIERIPVGRRRVERASVDCSGARTTEELVERVGRAVPPDPDCILELALTGVVGLEAAFDAGVPPAALAERYFSVRLAGPGPSREIPREELLAAPAETIAGGFVRTMLERIDAAPPDERALLEEALQIGVQLLAGRDPLG